MKLEFPHRPNNDPVARIETLEDAFSFIDMVNEPESLNVKIQYLFHAINNIDTEDFESFSHGEKSRLIEIWLEEIEDCKEKMSNQHDFSDDHTDL